MDNQETGSDSEKVAWETATTSYHELLTLNNEDKYQIMDSSHCKEEAVFNMVNWSISMSRKLGRHLDMIRSAVCLPKVGN